MPAINIGPIAEENVSGNITFDYETLIKEIYPIGG
jgi:hypothetical protein